MSLFFEVHLVKRNKQVKTRDRDVVSGKKR
jgi:hypothetical protein